ncbi:Zn-dependent hydrolase [Paenirhodobacter populi]|uniref:Zn-dependent hydrolase n=1 Tax=Paenirhodobacter populi TaxID=2306993 RepID=A0A443IQW0_9RHOB|nr:Zn-dependent hydrolase [Sinirhodobacter populi]RWR09229.1 Zn-dependent hydrolase [Sinirhodobacter populi]
MENLRIDGERLWANLMETARFGGTDDGGVRRLTLTAEDREVRAWLEARALAAGCSVSRDRLGNMFLRRAGRRDDLAPIAMGSHLDTQPTGGKFDGILGVLAGLEVIETLNEAGIETEHPIMLVNWTNEEGSRFAPAMLCSGAWAGVFTEDYVRARTDAKGISFGTALDAVSAAGEAPVGAEDFAAMFELHIEQGPVLEREELTIGVVTGVQGMRWYDLDLTGRAAHAGSTPMDARADALLAASGLIRGASVIASRLGGYATVGELTIRDPSRNVVPGALSMTFDLRHGEDAGLEAMESDLKAQIAGLEPGISADLRQIWSSPPVHFDPGCLASVREAAKSLGHRDMVSGAGHDAAYVARRAPTAMIFVPCAGGLSHNPAESATPEDCAAGAQVLLDALLIHDRRITAPAEAAA